MPLRLPYPKIAPKAYESMLSLGHYINTETALGKVLLGLVYLRASLLNHCDYCVHLHSAELLHAHEPQGRIDAVANWQSSDAFTPREKAALAWTDAVTTLEGHVPDEAYATVREFFEEKDLVDLTFAIAQINAWNRLGISFRAEWKSKAPHGAAQGQIKEEAAAGH